MMAHVFIRVELRGEPSSKDYENLHRYMEQNNWPRTIDGTGGQSMLPHAMYNGFSNNAISSIAAALQSGIQAKVWSRAIVLLISAENWAMQLA